jgi:hypothetical protein
LVEIIERDYSHISQPPQSFSNRGFPRAAATIQRNEYGSPQFSPKKFDRLENYLLWSIHSIAET